jgi:hypothetical protein
MDQKKQPAMGYEENASTPFDPETLHEKMLALAEDRVKANWLDVVLHDKNKLSTIQANHWCLWIAYESGSYLSPMYCNSAGECGPDIAPVIYHLLTIIQQPKSFGRIAASIVESEYDFYFLRKTLGPYGEIVKTTISEVIRIVLEGKFEWSPYGVQEIRQR